MDSKFKILLGFLLVIIAMLLIFIACFFYYNNNFKQTANENTPVVTPTPTATTEVQEPQEKRKTDLTAEDIIMEMKKRNSNIEQVNVFNEQTDPNQLLGRPNEYTSKIDFKDFRINDEELEQEGLNMVGGTIEVFQNETDLTTRRKYIEDMYVMYADFLNTTKEYFVQRGNALMRITYKLTPEQEKEYEDIFNDIMDNGILIETGQ